MILKNTIPLFPFFPKNSNEPDIPKTRLRPGECIYLDKVITQLSPSIIYTKTVSKINQFKTINSNNNNNNNNNNNIHLNNHDQDNPWSILSVLSPYSEDIHVMLMNTDPLRYMPCPRSHYIDPNEGNTVVHDIVHPVINFMYNQYNQFNQNTIGSVHMGYNWSPRSWGELEEKTGFQSIPTKWHLMIWRWPPVNSNESDSRSSLSSKTGFNYINEDHLSPEKKRLFTNDPAMHFISNIIVKELNDKLINISPLERFYFNTRDKNNQNPSELSQWYIHNNRIKRKFRGSLKDLTQHEQFFATMMQPIADVLEDILTRIHNSLTNDIDVRQVEHKIKDICENKNKTPETVSQLLDQIRQAPTIRDRAEINQQFNYKQWETNFVDKIWNALQMRSQWGLNEHLGRKDDEHPYQRDDSEEAVWWNAWRKGFGYSLCFNDWNAKTKIPDSMEDEGEEMNGEIVILVGCHCGGYGMVEANEVVLSRPEDRWMDRDRARQQSQVMWDLEEYLRTSRNNY